MGILIRLIFMPITLHSDLFFIHQYPALFYLEGTWNIYGYIQTHYQESIALHGWNYYPPATYLIILVWQLVVHLVSPTFYTLMQNLFAFENSGGGSIGQFLIMYSDPFRFMNIFLMKLPYMVFDIAALVLLIRLAQKQNRSCALIALFWWLNPLSIYATYMFGQLDIIPAVLTLCAVSRFSTKESITVKDKMICLFVLGLATGFKLYPILLVVPTLLVIEKSWMVRVKLLAAFGIVPLILTMVMYSSTIHLLSVWYPSFILRATEQTILASAKQIAFFVLYLLVTIAAWRFQKPSLPFLSGMYIVIFFGLFSLTQYHSLHYLLWMLPFLPLWFTNIKHVYFLSWILFILLVGFRIMARQHQLGLFIPIDPLLFSSLPSLAEGIGNYIPYRVVSDTAYTVYQGILITGAVLITFRLHRRAAVSYA